MTEIENVNQWIRSRRSLYPAQMDADQKIPEATIKALLENANYAPSHKITDPWYFQVFHGDSLRMFFKEMGRIYTAITPPEDFQAKKLEKFDKKAEQLSHLIAICMKRDPKERVPIQEEEYAVACAVQNMYLSFDAYGIIGYWGTGKIAFSDEMKEFLGLGEKDKCLGFLQLGIPKAGLNLPPKPAKNSIEDKVRWW